MSLPVDIRFDLRIWLIFRGSCTLNRHSLLAGGLNLAVKCYVRGYGAAGSAPHWQCGGHGFESR